MKRSEFKLPELKVGTLDSLIQLSDELAKADTYGESVSRKVATYFADILDNDRAQLKEHLKLANNIDPNGKNFYPDPTYPNLSLGMPIQMGRRKVSFENVITRISQSYKYIFNRNWSSPEEKIIFV